eukprot:9231352-Alexandrium_andersonii.AAC.1
MSASLVGSEMCIRDSRSIGRRMCPLTCPFVSGPAHPFAVGSMPARGAGTVSYTHLTLPTICSV